MNLPAPASAPPAIFIHGIARRSGTNYLRWLLSCHPQVAVSPQKIWEFPHLSVARHLLDYADGLLLSSKLPGLNKADVLAALGNGLLELARKGLDAGVSVLIKEPSVDGIEQFFDFFPTAQLVLLVRDGRDVSHSLARTRFGDEPMPRWRRWGAAMGLLRPVCAVRAKAWSASSRRIAALCEASTGPWRTQCTVIRYEDLIVDLRGTLAPLLERLQLDSLQFDWPAALGIKIKGSSFVGVADPRQGLNWSGVEPDAVVFAPVGRWRSWSKRELSAFQRVAGPELERWGYPIEQ